MRKRNRENIGLPNRWRHYHGAYFYQVPEGQEHHWDGKKQFRLGKTLSEAYKSFGERVATHSSVSTMEHLFDRYLSDVLSSKAPATQRSNQISLRRLRGFFGSNQIARIRPKHIYQFRDMCTQKHGPISANRDLEVLSHSFTKAIEWGAIDEHPMAGKKVVKNPSQKRTRYVEDWELEQFLSVASPFLVAYVRLKLILGLRKGDMLSIKLEDISDDGLQVIPRKTAKHIGKPVIYSWSQTLRHRVNHALLCRPRPTSQYLFCTRSGSAYIDQNGLTSGFDSIWQRAMKRALMQTSLEVRFTEHDLRAKVASDTSPKHAQVLMGHSSAKTTEQIYRRKATRIKPAL